MVESRTARMRLVQWSSGTDSPQRVDFNETFLNIETLAAIDQQGTLTNRPTPTKAGMYYFATDQGTLYRADGVSWAVVGSSVLSQYVKPARTDQTAQTIQALASQTADITQIMSGASVVYQKITKTGGFIHGPLKVAPYATTLGATEDVPTDSAVSIVNSEKANSFTINIGNSTLAGTFLRLLKNGATLVSIANDGVATFPKVIVSADPATANELTRKQYVDAKVAQAVYSLSTTNISGVLPTSKGGLNISTVTAGSYLRGASTADKYEAVTPAQVLTDIGGATAGHTHDINSTSITGVLGISRGGTGSTTVASARTALSVPINTTTITAGAGLLGGGDLTANRTITANLPTSNSTAWGGNVGTSNVVARYDHSHNLANEKIIGVLPVANGGTGGSTPATALSGIGAAASMTSISTGAGLLGGGNLTADRTLTVNFGGTGSATTVSRSDHTHLASDLLTRLTYDQLPQLGELPNAADLDTYTSDSEWTQTSTAEAAAGTNYPTGIAGKLRVVGSSTGNMIWQTYISYVPSMPDVYIRTRYNGAWGAWRRLASVDDITKLASVYAPLTHGHSLADANITGVLPVAQGGTGSTTAANARSALAAASNAITIAAGSGLTGGGNLTANRTIAVSFGGTGTATTVSRSDHTHVAADITDRLTNAQMPLVILIPTSGSDLNTYKTPGIYYQPTNTGASSGANYPESTAGHLFVYDNSSTLIHQEYRPATSATPSIYIRLCSPAGTWGPWSQVSMASDVTNALKGYASITHTHTLSDANITGVLPLSKGGTGSTTAADARTALAVPVNTTTLTAGPGLSGGGNLTANRTFSVVFEGSGTKSTSARSDHGHALTDANITGVLPLVQGGTGASTASGALTNLGAASATTSMSAGQGLTGGGDLSANRSFSVNFGGSGTATTSARSDHGHVLTDANITGVLPLDKGGMGRSVYTNNTYMKYVDATQGFNAMTPANVRSDIGALASNQQAYIVRPNNLPGWTVTTNGIVITPLSNGWLSCNLDLTLVRAAAEFNSPAGSFMNHGNLIQPEYRSNLPSGQYVMGVIGTVIGLFFISWENGDLLGRTPLGQYTVTTGTRMSFQTHWVIQK